MLIVNKHCAIFKTSIKWTPSIKRPPPPPWVGPEGVRLIEVSL